MYNMLITCSKQNITEQVLSFVTSLLYGLTEIYPKNSDINMSQ